MSFKTCKTPSAALAVLNKVWINSADFEQLFGSSSAVLSLCTSSEYPTLTSVVGPADDVQSGFIGVNEAQRTFLAVPLGKNVTYSIIDVMEVAHRASITFLGQKSKQYIYSHHRSSRSAFVKSH
ncbi:hypothetical protein GEMRC1_011169 [Eukaryota sp. GEM-RC1]